MLILINTSKTMGQVAAHTGSRTPALLKRAELLAGTIASLTPVEIAKLMHISADLAAKTKTLFDHWQTSTQTTAALDAFQGDIFKGLRAHTFDNATRAFADTHLRIISGLYGILRPFDAIKPYRLELLYKLRIQGAKDLYDFWQDAPASQLPKSGPIIQLASQEYFQLIQPYIAAKRVIAPRFMTQLPGEASPSFVTVHAKVTRGAFARWLLVNRIDSPSALHKFNDLGYSYNDTESTPDSPLFITNQAIKPTTL